MYHEASLSPASSANYKLCVEWGSVRVNSAVSCNMCVTAVFREDPKRQYTTRCPFLQLVVQTTNCVLGGVL
jgi:hypothetical protein